MAARGGARTGVRDRARRVRAEQGGRGPGSGVLLRATTRGPGRTRHASTPQRAARASREASGASGDEKPEKRDREHGPGSIANAAPWRLSTMAYLLPSEFV